MDQPDDKVALQAQLRRVQEQLCQAECALAISLPEHEAACLDVVITWQAVVDEISKMLNTVRDTP